MIKPKFGECSECNDGKEIRLARIKPPQCLYHYNLLNQQRLNEKARNKPNKPRKRIKGVSSSKLKELAKYRLKRDNYLRRTPTCEVHDCAKPSDNLHHKAGRYGKLLTDEKYFMACCGSCHPQRIHENPAWSREHNYLITIN